MKEERLAQSEEAMLSLGAELVARFRVGDAVLLSGALGAGKTTLVRGMLRGLGHTGPVRSPTFNLMQEFDTQPPVLHVDLYRLEHTRGLGLEEYLDERLCLIEWPDRLGEIVDVSRAWRVEIEFAASGRRISVSAPDERLR